MGRTEKYVIGLIERALGPADSVRRFEWAQGDVSPKTGRKTRLPFDAVWEARRLIVEVDEEQHTEATPLFDKPYRLTVSGVDRGAQRQRYDERKRAAARAQGYLLVEIRGPRSRKKRPTDAEEIMRILQEAGVFAARGRPGAGG